MRYRSSRPEVFCKKVVFENPAKFTGKHLSLFLVNLQDYSLKLDCIKKKFRNRCFSVNFAKFRNTSQRLLLYRIFCLVNFNELVFQDRKNNFVKMKKRGGISPGGVI